MVERDVDVDDISIFEDILVWDAVADDFVDGCADGFGEMAVIQWRRV